MNILPSPSRATRREGEKPYQNDDDDDDDEAKKKKAKRTETKTDSGASSSRDLLHSFLVGCFFFFFFFFLLDQRLTNTFVVWLSPFLEIGTLVAALSLYYYKTKKKLSSCTASTTYNTRTTRKLLRVWMAVKHGEELYFFFLTIQFFFLRVCNFSMRDMGECTTYVLHVCCVRITVVLNPLLNTSSVDAELPLPHFSVAARASAGREERSHRPRVGGQAAAASKCRLMHLYVHATEEMLCVQKFGKMVAISASVARCANFGYLWSIER